MSFDPSDELIKCFDHFFLCVCVCVCLCLYFACCNPCYAGHITSKVVSPDQFSDLIVKSIPLSSPAQRKDRDVKEKLVRQKHGKGYTIKSVEVDMLFSNYLDSAAAGSPVKSEKSGSGQDFECMKKHLDNLFYLAEGSSPDDQNLRNIFFKVFTLMKCSM